MLTLSTQAGSLEVHDIELVSADTLTYRLEAGGEREPFESAGFFRITGPDGVFVSFHGPGPGGLRYMIWGEAVVAKDEESFAVLPYLDYRDEHGIADSAFEYASAAYIFVSGSPREAGLAGDD